MLRYLLTLATLQSFPLWIIHQCCITKFAISYSVEKLSNAKWIFHRNGNFHCQAVDFFFVRSLFVQQIAPKSVNVVCMIINSVQSISQMIFVKFLALFTAIHQRHFVAAQMANSILGKRDYNKPSTVKKQIDVFIWIPFHFGNFLNCNYLLWCSVGNGWAKKSARQPHRCPSENSILLQLYVNFAGFISFIHSITHGLPNNPQRSYCSDVGSTNPVYMLNEKVQYRNRMMIAHKIIWLKCYYCFLITNRIPYPFRFSLFLFRNLFDASNINISKSNLSNAFCSITMLWHGS